MHFSIAVALLVVLGVASAASPQPDFKDLVLEELHEVEKFIQITEEKIRELIKTEDVNPIEKFLLHASEALLEQLDSKIEEIENLLGAPRVGLDPIEILQRELRLIEDVIVDLEERLEAVKQKGNVGPIGNMAIDTFESVLRFVEQEVENVEDFFGPRATKVSSRNIRTLIVKELELMDELIVKFEKQVESLQKVKEISEITKTALNVVDTLLKQVQAGIEELEKQLRDPLVVQEGPIVEVLALLKEVLERFGGALENVEQSVRNVIDTNQVNFLVKIALQAFDTLLVEVEKAVQTIEKTLFP